ncbi:MAG: GlcNAc-PI de-N-acetylase [Candidatus Wallbacteria bacterium HGW-Wallbacteria-1]|jgi:LmbE family N-acetylglucosaminyl deacetylase|uniref:GlcNAc-PI de-N-acetylase n=1 Tax=Candidatus Wallbacteria bacterium HGW-Wallbacteria-1 TaxID=2013854 RepID=A0A2N1PLA1_9BACT|nr:MAG: GlcNAc-PI de-N-acetylase [Candidatus Wallbacteria bacterium HGW-Wallbacteria-1]
MRWEGMNSEIRTDSGSAGNNSNKHAPEFISAAPLNQYPFTGRTLVIAAHPDDETLGCGGTVARLAAAGKPASVVILGRGLESRGPAETDDLQNLRRESLRAMNELGIEKAAFMDFPDNRFDSIDMLDLVQSVEEAIREFKPDLVLTHNPEDLNIDHRLTFQAVITALRPIQEKANLAILCFEVPSSTEWAGNNGFKPAILVDISTTLKHKIHALSQYRSETRNWPHPRSGRGLTAYSDFRGMAAGMEGAEAFSVFRMPFR